jgi:hypothetical protein
LQPAIAIIRFSIAVKVSNALLIRDQLEREPKFQVGGRLQSPSGGEMASEPLRFVQIPERAQWSSPEQEQRQEPDSKIAGAETDSYFGNRYYSMDAVEIGFPILSSTPKTEPR